MQADSLWEEYKALDRQHYVDGLKREIEEIKNDMSGAFGEGPGQRILGREWTMGVPVKLPAIHERARAAWMEEQAKLTVALLGVSRKDADELADEKEHAAKPSGGPFPPPAGMALKERFPPPEEEGRLDPFEEALKLARGL